MALPTCSQAWNTAFQCSEPRRTPTSCSSTEIDSFRAFAKTFPDTSTFLIDTYDDLKGAENAAIVAKELEKAGHRLNAVRLDSGDLLGLSKKVRQILDSHGLDYVKILASGDLDEYAIEQLLKKEAKIDAFGVGTRMSTSYDRPYVDVVYKLSGKVEHGAFVPAMKLSRGKLTLPGKKQIFRRMNRKGRYVKDIIGLEHEKVRGKPLLEKVMENGHITHDMPTLEEIRTVALKNLAEFPDRCKKLTHAPVYPVELSRELSKIKNDLMRQLKNSESTA
jgi:nicotinate phosphoribosyltransferase